MLSHDKETNPESEDNSSDLFTLQIACNGLLNIFCSLEVVVCCYPFRFVNCK